MSVIFNTKKIGIIYKFDPNWMGGTIYVFNLLRALECAQKQGLDLPRIIIFINRYSNIRANIYKSPNKSSSRLALPSELTV